jgi:hypothetical protein
MPAQTKISAIRFSFSTQSLENILLLRFLLISVVVFSPLQLFTQNGNENVSFSMNKNINTYKFRNTYRDFISFDFGNFVIDQNYSGTAILRQTSTLREEEELMLNFHTHLLNSFYYTTNQNLRLYSDPNAADNNELQRLSTTHGLKYESDIFNAELPAGIEYNKQFEIIETGWLVEPKFELRNYDYGGYRINSLFESQFLSLKDNRINNKYDFKLGMNKNFNKSDYLNFLFLNDFHNRDILTRLKGTESLNTQDPAVENISDNKYNINLNLGYELFENFNTSVSMNFSNVSADRYYKKFNEENTTTLIKKNYDENLTNLIFDTEYRTNYIYQKTGFEYSVRNERNHALKNGDISDSDFEREQNLEKQRDNNSERTRIYSFSELLLPYNSAFFLNYSASIFRYNTPSDNNNDDRDLSSFYIETGLKHKFSSFLDAKISFKYDNSHIVFLKSSRSGSNYANKSYSLKPEISYKNEVIAIRPQFQLLANYTVYDYEKISSGISSFSFRQISYNDSVYIQLPGSIGLYSQIILKYYERGTFFQDDFSESPELSSNENFIKLIAFFNEISKTFSGLNIGVGLRYYKLKQDGLRQTNIGKNFNRMSYGPEAIIELDFFSGTSLIFNGWYEYQYSDNNFIRALPNFYLQTRVGI